MMNLLSLIEDVPLSAVTLIPDGNDQPLTSEEDGQIFALNVGDQTTVANAPVLTFANDDVSFGNGGAALTTGDTATVSVEGDGGTVVNFPSGVIVSHVTAIDLLGDDGGVVNAGLIAGGVNGVRFVGDGGELHNTGDIESDSRAVEIIGSDVEIRNLGDIFGTGDQRNGTVYANSTAEDYALLNGAAGRIDAGFGNDGAGVSFEVGDATGESVDAQIVNAGSIAGRGDAASGENSRGDGIRLFSSVPGGTTYDGDIVNEGFVTSDFARGIEIRDGLGFSGTIVNSGVIFGAADGLYFGDAPHDAEVLNAGVIASDSRAVNIDGSNVEIVNEGRILGSGDQRNGTVYSDATADDFSLLNAPSGVIDAGPGNRGAGVVYQVGATPGDVVEAGLVNHGLVAGRGDGTGNLAGDGVRLFAGSEGPVFFAGDILNTGEIVGSQDGIDVNATGAGFGYAGDIENRGTIGAEETGIKISANTNFAGDVLNSGGIDAGTVGIEFGENGTFAGEVVNSGSIDAEIDGVTFLHGTNSAGAIVNSGTIGAGAEGIGVGPEASFAGQIRNSGEIDAGDDAIDIGERVNFIGDIQNDETLRGAEDGIDVQQAAIFVGDIVNRGTIEGTGESGIEVGAGAGFTGDILNDGNVVGGQDGIEVDSGAFFRGRIANGPDGVIEGAVNGVEIANVLEGPEIVNEGTILSASRAVNLDGEGTGLVNEGEILGAGDQRNGTVYANSTAENYAIENLGLIDAGDGNDGSGVSLQTGEIDGTVVVASLINDGTIRGRGDAGSGNTIGDGVRVFSDVADAVWQGDIVNAGLIEGSQGSPVAVGLRIEDGVTLDGRIVNDGTIAGSEVAVDVSEAGGSVEIVNDGEISGDVLLSAGDDAFDGTNGSVDGVIEGNGGDDEIIGGASGDRLAGGAGDDELTGGGEADVFIFAPSDAPSFDTVTDFEDGSDIIDVSAFGFAGFGDVAVEQAGDDTLLTFAAGDQATLLDVQAGDIAADDFIF